MFRTALFKFGRSFILDTKQQGCLVFIHKLKNSLIHGSRCCRSSPSVTGGKRIQRPQLLIITLGGDDGFPSGDSRNDSCQFIAASDMSGQYLNPDYMLDVNVNHCRIGIFVPDAGSNTSHTDAECTDKNDCFKIGKMFFHKSAVRGDCFASLCFSFEVYGGFC